MNIVDEIISKQKENGGDFWSRKDGNIHAPNGSSTIDTLFVLGELGIEINAYPFIVQSIDFLLSYQTDEGSFKYSQTSSKLPCITARIISALKRLNVSNSKIEKSYNWLINNQWNDGGWRCATVKLGKSPLTDLSNPGTTLYVLDAFRFRDNNKNVVDRLNNGVDFLLQHWDIRQPIGPCSFGIGSRFLQIEYPFLRYNLFYYIYVLSFYDKAINDSRFIAALSYLSDKIINNKIIIESSHKSWQKFDFSKKGKESWLAQKRWDEIKNNLDTKKIEQLE